MLIQIEYKIDPSKLHEFTMAMEELSTIRKRDGAFYWGLFRHDKKENVYTLKVSLLIRGSSTCANMNG